MAPTGRPWELRAGEIASLLGIAEPELYRRVYAATLGRRPILDLSVATAAFGPDNMGELVTLLLISFALSLEKSCLVGNFPLKLLIRHALEALLNS